jgi:hypothetical protein
MVTAAETVQRGACDRTRLSVESAARGERDVASYVSTNCVRDLPVEEFARLAGMRGVIYTYGLP